MTNLSADTLKDMRDWCLECAADDNDEQDILDATDEQIVRYVRRSYCGGVGQFIHDAGGMTPAYTEA